MTRIVTRNPVLAYVLAGLALRMISWLMGANYDDGGLPGVLFGLTVLFNGVVWAVAEVMFELNDEKSFPMMSELVVLLSIATSLGVDAAIRRWRSRSSSEGPRTEP